MELHYTFRTKKKSFLANLKNPRFGKKISEANHIEGNWSSLRKWMACAPPEIILELSHFLTPPTHQSSTQQTLTLLRCVPMCVTPTSLIPVSQAFTWATSFHLCRQLDSLSRRRTSRHADQVNCSALVLLPVQSCRVANCLAAP